MTAAPLRTFGRIRARRLKPRQAALIETARQSLAIPEGAIPLEPGRETWLEIGFGGGEHLAAQAGAHPEVLMLGAEPFENGVASALRHVEDGRLGNVRLFQGDAREVMARLPDACLARLIILFPDPWQKARHQKRRLLTATFLDEAARVLAPEGRLSFATDWADYADQALSLGVAHPAFRWTAERADDWRRPPAGHFTTRYEAKRLGDCAPVWLEFARP